MDDIVQKRLNLHNLAVNRGGRAALLWQKAVSPDTFFWLNRFVSPNVNWFVSFNKDKVFTMVCFTNRFSWNDESIFIFWDKTLLRQKQVSWDTAFCHNRAAGDGSVHTGGSDTTLLLPINLSDLHFRWFIGGVIQCEITRRLSRDFVKRSPRV